MDWEGVSCADTAEMSVGTSPRSPGGIWDQRRGAALSLHIVTWTKKIILLRRSGSPSWDVYRAHCGSWVAEIFEEAAWPRVPSPLPIIYIFYFSTETVRKPILLATKTRARENMDFVILTCGTDATSIEWFFNGRRLALRKTMELAEHNTALIIDPVRREDEGFYHCEVFNAFSFYKSDPLILYVVQEWPFFPPPCH